MSAYLLAKIRGKLSRMVEDADIDALAAADLDTILQRLHESSYGVALSKVEGVARLSDRLRQGFFSDVFALFFSLQGENRDLLSSVLARYRVENLKTILRAHIRHLPPEEVKAHLFALPWEKVDYMHLLDLPGIDALIKEIPWSDYRRRLAAVHRQVGDKAVTFPYEAALDALYLQRLLDYYTRHQPDVKQILKNRILRELFSWAFRLKGYGFSFPELVNLLPDFRLLVSQEEMRRIIEDAEGWRGVSRFLGTSLGEELTRADTFDLSTLEELFDRKLRQVVREAFVMSPFGMGIVIGYVYLKELELSRLVELIERARVRG